MSKEQNHPSISFASRYGGTAQHYLTAYISIARMETLLDDLNVIGEMERKERSADVRWFPWYGTEAYSYYSVGYVTCLEWHARSRLIDLLEHQPSSLQVEDVKGAISDKLVVQMVAEQASVAQLVAASLKVGSLERYLSVIGRVFKALQIPCTPTAWLFGTAPDANVCWISPEGLKGIQYVFDFRHDLVHEIGQGTIGHWNIRESWDISMAQHSGRLVMSVIAGIEAALTKYAPTFFPNLLTKEGYPISSSERYRSRMDELDSIMEDKKGSWGWEEDGVVEDWDKARQRFSDYLSAEIQFINRIRPAYWRYIDVTTPLATRLFRYRIDFLQELITHIDKSEGDTPDSNSNGEA